ncbi:MAG: hypothetical protein HeimC3_34130 [Candidatus Heimdallarchaeota archaeon LC_3]|nr:MAG: hypothetical protein HeimC3_34130 [Candidatus Heimdallarchaeota archaeon LC_3]
MYKSGDVILAQVQFTDTFEIKKRPALILYHEHNNIIVAGITSNQKMTGITLSKTEGAIKDSIIKTNYLFTISEVMIERILFHLNKTKKEIVYNDLVRRFKSLIE